MRTVAEEMAFALTKAQTEIENLNHSLSVEKELHLDAVQIANDQRAKADRELRRADLLEEYLTKKSNQLEQYFLDHKNIQETLRDREYKLGIITNAFERAMFALEALRDAALSYHDYDCHGDNCATCCDLVESVNRANDILIEHQPKA
jgi:hypothetical protein